MKTATLRGADPEHPASGSVTIDSRHVTLENVSITEAPDARVILTRNHDEPSGIRLGPLQSFSGTHRYELPADTQLDDYDSITIWCDKFSVPIGLARF